MITLKIQYKSSKFSENLPLNKRNIYTLFYYYFQMNLWSENDMVLNSGG